MVSTTPVNRRVSRFVCAQTFWAMLVLLHTFGHLSAGPARSQSVEGNPEINWIEVEAGDFTMGSGNAAKKYVVDRFFISATEVTFDQYDAYCSATGTPKPGDNGFGRGTRPVLHVSYDDALGFCRWLSQKTGKAVRLPNEVEWVYAAHGGRRSRGYTFSGGNDKDEVSWNEDNSGGQTHPVGTKKPNELGIFDMSGNLWEWCADWSAPEPGRSQRAPEKSEDENTRILCGDSFDNPGSRQGYRISLRLEKDARHCNIGFRIARSE